MTATERDRIRAELERRRQALAERRRRFRESLHAVVVEEARAQMDGPNGWDEA